MNTVTALTDITTHLILKDYKKDINFYASINKNNAVGSDDLEYKKLVKFLKLDVKSINYKKENDYELFNPVALIQDKIETEKIIRSYYAE